MPDGLVTVNCCYRSTLAAACADGITCTLGSLKRFLFAPAVDVRFCYDMTCLVKMGKCQPFSQRRGAHRIGSAIHFILFIEIRPRASSLGRFGHERHQHYMHKDERASYSTKSRLETCG